MFSSNIKPFSQNTTFGNTSTNSPFTNKNQLNNGFPPNPPTSTFGQPATNTMFPSMQPSNLFQSPNASNFNTGTTTNQTGFGTSIFGQQPQPSTSGLFGNTSTFGQQNKQTFGFGSPTPAPTLFGQQAQQPAGPSLFQSNPTTNLFGNNSAFGGQPQQSGTVIKFSPVTGTDTMQKNGVAQQISTKHHCITCMKEYENKSLEELRFEDYSVNRKGPQQGQTGFASTPAFGGGGAGGGVVPPNTSMPTLFDNKSTFGAPGTFGQTNNTFGMNTSNNNSNVFGKPTGFGTTTTSSNTFGFNPTPTTSTLFGGSNQQQSKQFTPLFGQTTTQPPQTGFGTNVFGQTTNQNMGTNLFQKPQTTTTGFNAGQTGFTFNTQPATTQQQSTNLFQVSKPNTGFSLFNTSTNTSGFGTTTQQPQQQQQQTGFGTFGKPMTTPQFGQPTQQTGFGSTLGVQQGILFGGNAPKPTLFSNPTSSTGLFSQNVFQQPTNTFNLQMNQQQPQQQQQMIFPPESADIMKNMTLLASDIFPDGPHIYGLEPVLSESNNNNNKNSTTNPAEIKNLLDYSKNQGDFNIAKTKVKVHLPKSKRDPGIIKEFFDDIKDYRSERRTLVIRKQHPQQQQQQHKENNQNQYDPIYCNYKNDLLEEADRCINKDRKLLHDPESYIGNLSNLERKTDNSPDNSDKNQNATIFDSVNNSHNAIDDDDDDNDNQQNKNTSNNSSKSDNTPKHLDKGVSTTTGIRLNEDDVSVSKDDYASINDKSNIEDDQQKTDDSIDDNPAGVILTRPEYYIIPPLNDLHQYIDDNGDCIVQGLTIGRRSYGNVHFPDPINIKNMNFDEIVHFRHREIIIYPDDSKKPQIGDGLNRRAQVTLDKIYPREKGTNEYIKDIDKILQSNFVDNLMIVTQKHNCKFVDYRPETGSWVFKVKHFSKYGLTDSDEEECEVSSDLLLLQKKTISELQQQQQQDIDDVGNIGLGGISQIGQPTQQQHELPPSSVSTAFDWPEVSSCHYDEEELRKKSFVQVMKANLFDEQMEQTIPTTKLEETEYEKYPQGCDVITTPKYHTLNYLLPPVEDKIIARCYSDLGLFKRKAFNVGWLKGYNFFQYDEVNLDVKIAKAIAQWKIDTCDHDFDKMMPDIVDCLKIVFEESDISFDRNEIPTYKIKKGRDYLKKQTILFTNYAKNQQLSSIDLYVCSIWNLCMALWGDDSQYNTDEDRREYFSNWLRKFTYDLTDDRSFIPKQAKTQDDALNLIFELLTYNRIDEAAELAFEFNMNYLALLIGQCGLTQIEKNVLMNYVQNYAWKDNATPDLYKKIFILIAGLPTVGTINIFQNIDWLRCLGLHLWYITPSSAPIYYVVEQYKKSFNDDCNAIKPHPPYGDLFTDSNDLLYEILQLYIYNNAYRLCHVLDPATHTSNPMDHRFSWILYQLFQSLNIGLIDDNERIFLHTSLATQLENDGNWEWAIFVLLYINNPTLKRNMIMRILERNISPHVDTIDIEERLVRKYRLPSKWIHEVKAYQSKLTSTSYETYKHFIDMNNIRSSNDLLVNNIIPELFINEQYDDIERFINKIELYKNEIYEWKNNVGLFKDFLQIQDKHVVVNDDKFGFEIEFRTICNRIKSYPRKTNEQRLSIAELSKKCAFLYRKLFDDQNDQNYIENRLFGLFKQFVMPPDYEYLEVLYDILKLINNLDVL